MLYIFTFSILSIDSLYTEHVLKMARSFGTRINARGVKLDAAYGGKEWIGLSSIEESCNVQECPG